ncbi:hypothetical protein J6590_021473 [Homalodisca vitripennis]|nr:hypothetical protein J6590_021473 [Homalodisca vitripennis]
MTDEKHLLTRRGGCFQCFDMFYTAFDTFNKGHGYPQIVPSCLQNLDNQGGFVPYDRRIGAVTEYHRVCVWAPLCFSDVIHPNSCVDALTSDGGKVNTKDLVLVNCRRVDKHMAFEGKLLLEHRESHETDASVSPDE